MAIDLSTTATLEVLDVTDRVGAALPAEHDGTCTVFCPHTTAAVVVNEAESRLIDDAERFLESLVPADGWDHDRLDGNAASHLRAMLLGPSVTLPVKDGRLELGTWQSVLFVECDGPRSREVSVIT